MRPLTRISASLALLITATGVWHFSGTEKIAPTAPAPLVAAVETAASHVLAAPQRATAIAPAERAGIFGKFDAWAARYAATTTIEEKQALLGQGVSLANARRLALKELIAADPRAAIERAVPPVVRQQLPRVIAQRLEERVNESAFYGVLGALPGAGSEVGAALRRHVRTDDGANYRAFVFGARSRQQTTERASIVGIAVDDFLAVDESPLRVVAAGEIPNHPNNLTQRRTVSRKNDAGFIADRELREMASAKPLSDTCPVSEITSPLPDTGAPVAAEQVVVEAEGKFQFLCSGGHVHAFRDTLVAREGGNGGPQLPTNPPATTQSTGYRSHLLMRVAFPEALRASVTEKDGHDLGKNVQDWFVDSSYGKLTFATTVTPLLVLPRTDAWYKSVDSSGSAYEVLSDARAAAKAAGFDPAAFHFDTVIYTGSAGSFGGQAYVGGKGCWLKSGTGTGVAAHEYGHNFGLWHANYWNASTSTIGTGSHSEYGDSFDTMGSASAGDLQFNACHKNMLGWITTPLVHDVRESGTYRIYQMDQPRQDPALRYAAKIRKDSDRDYWIDLRQKFATNRWVQGGIFLHWSPWLASEGGSHLLDSTPGSPDGKTDSPVVVGRTFSDFETGIHITPVAKNATVPTSFDVVVNLGSFPANQAPVLALAADQSAVATNAVVTFTATASDPDSDPLSYWWEFGDKEFSTANTATVAKSWATVGDYAVRCVVSDMKGKTASAIVVVRVGSPTTFKVSGNITLGGQPLTDAYINVGGKTAYTNTDGGYTVTGLAAGTHTISPVLFGYTFTPVTSATATVGPDATGVNFTAALTNNLSITAVTPTVAEAASGTFRITRTGSTTSALTVNALPPTGFASSGSDYTLTPATVYADPYNTYTIPAGAASLDITFAALNDTGQEGSEPATLQLLPGSGYTLTNAAATIVITDTDSTTKSLVRLVTLDNDATESGGNGRWIIERLGGDQTGALNVSVAYSGTATNGTDYATLGTTVTIPANQSTATVTFAPTADTAIEGTETATLTINTNTNYVRASSSAEYTGTINLTDAQNPTITVTAADATAVEGTADTGVFLITRTGDTTAPLLVGYGLTGSALHGADYAAVPGQLTIPAGHVAGSVAITAIEDTIGEPTQTARLYLRASDKYVIGTPGEATVNITDSDIPYASVATTAQAIEGGASGTFRVTTTGTGTGNITVRYTITGTATNGVDFTALGGTLSMGKNATASLTIVPIQDTDIEGYETVTVTLDADPAYTLAVDSAATMNLQDDEAAQVNVSTTDDTFTEATGSLARFFLSRTGATTAALTVNYTMSGTATSGDDYTAPAGVATIAAGSTGVEVSIAILDDALVEGGETITLNVTPDAAYTLGYSSATHWLEDVEQTAESFRFNPNAVAVNEGDTATATITLSAAAPTDRTVDYAITGGTALAGGMDYTLTRGTVTFLAGETSKTITFPIADDTVPENSETIIITLDRPIGGRLTGTTANRSVTFTIAANDTIPAPNIGFAQAAAAALENVTTAPIFVTLSNPQAGPISVDYAVTGGTATAGDDYAITAGTLTFAAGETAKLVPATIVDDGGQEANETIIVTLSNPAGATLNTNTAHTYTITDNDTVTITVAASDATATEPADHGAFTVTRAGSTLGAVTVNVGIGGSATPDSDYTALATTVEFATGVTAVVVPVTVLDDLVGETAETVTLSISPGSYVTGTPNTATVTLNDDEPVVTVNSSDNTATELGQTTGTVTFTRTGATTAALPLDTLIAGSAVNGTDYALISTPLEIPAGSASLTLTIAPVDDPTPEGNETVVVTLNAAAGYRLGSPVTQTVTIADDDVNSAPTVARDWPTAAAVSISDDVGIILETTVADDGKPVGGSLSTAWTKFSGPGTVTFGSPTLPDTTATFSAPGLYVLRLTANDGELTTTLDTTVTVMPTTSATWTGTAIGTVSPAGSNSETDGTFTVVGGGANITGTADQCRLVHQPLYGDGEVIARVVSFAATNSSGKAGVMLRASTATNSAMGTMFLYSPANTSDDTSFRYRLTNGSTAASTSTDGPTLPYWVRLTRTGNAIRAYQSPNGTTWTAVGTAQTLPAGEPMLAGLVVTSGASALAATAVFDNVSILSTPGNVGPLVSAGSAVSTVAPQPASLEGSVSDDAKPVGALVTTTWEKVSGPGDVTFADATEPATTATFSAPGVYELRLIASDTVVKTFDWTTVTTTLPSVAITVNAPTMTEANSPTRTFTITRTGSGDSTLGVAFTRGGTATATDYTDTSGLLAAGALSIPIGNTSATIETSAILDAEVEATETLTLTLNTSANYQLGTPSAATLDILDAAVVALAATDTTATEHGLTPGQFTLTRTGDTTAALTVGITWTGTATAGADFSENAATIEFAAGSATATLPLTPLADTLAEGAETATLTLAATTAYALAVQNSGTVTLADLPADDWRLAQFGPEANNPLIAADHADPDGDGLNNLLEYALAANPTTHTPPPASALADGYITLTFRRPVAPADLTYHVEFTTDLALGFPQAGVLTNSVNNGDGTLTQTWRAPSPTSAEPFTLGRVRVVKP